MRNSIGAFVFDDSGQGLVEYSLVILLVAIAAIAALTTFGKAANVSLSSSAGQMPR